MAETSLELSDKIEDVVLSECEFVFGGCILGHLPSGKNNYEICGNRLIKSEVVTAYENSFMMQMAWLKNVKKQPTIMDFDGKKRRKLVLSARVYFQDWRRDVDTILFCDLLQKSEVIKNDRMIRFKIINGVSVDKDRPRVEFKLFEVRHDK